MRYLVLIVSLLLAFPSFAATNDDAAITASCKHQMRHQSQYELHQCIEQQSWAFSGLQLEKQIAPQDYNKYVVWCVAHQPVDTDYLFILACVSVDLHQEILSRVLPKQE